MKNAAKNGVKLIVADPRRNELERHATHFLQFKPDTDVALLNAMIHSIIDEDLVDKKFIADRTSGFEALKENAKNFSPEKMAPVCGVPAQTIREVARLRHFQELDDLLGHGDQPARARHRQRALPDRAHPDDRADRAAGHRPASAARAEQRAGRLRLWPHPDGVPRLPAGRPPGCQPAL